MGHPQNPALPVRMIVIAVAKKAKLADVRTTPVEAPHHNSVIVRVPVDQNHAIAVEAMEDGEEEVVCHEQW